MDELRLDAANEETAAARADRERRRRVVAVTRRFLTHLGSLVRQLAVHDPRNAAVKAVLDDLGRDAFELGRTADVTAIVFAEGHTFVNGVWVRTTARAWDSAQFLTSTLARMGARGVRFFAGVGTGQLLHLTQRLREAANWKEDRPEELEDIGIDGIELILLPDDDKDEDGSRVKFRKRAVELLEEGMLAGDPGRLANLDVYLRRRQRALALRLVQMAEETPEDLLMLTAVRDATITSIAHNLMVAILSIAIGRLMDFRRRDLVRLGVCALSHNVGETLLPPELFALERKYTDAELALARQHPLMGMAHLLEEFGFEVPIVERALASAEHHLHFDGGGYPQIGLHQPHIFARIIAVADVFNALASPRPQRGEFPPDQAMKLVNRKAMAQLDPLVVRVFVRLVGRYPPGSLVELDTGEFGVVLGPGQGLKPLIRPRVLLLTDPEGFELDMPVLCDLGERHERRRAWLRTIVRTRDPKNMAVPVSRYLMADRIESVPGRMDIDDPSVARKRTTETDQMLRRRFEVASASRAPGALSEFGLGVTTMPRVPDDE